MTSEIETNIVAVERINEYINVENEVRRNQRKPGTRPKKKKKSYRFENASSPYLEISHGVIKVLWKSPLL